MVEARSRGRDRRRTEIGGEFQVVPIPNGPKGVLPSPHRRFSLATHAMLAAWGSLDQEPGRRLHLPDYFCPVVADAWSFAGIPLVPFRDDPSRTQSDWTSLDPRPGDVVLAVNFFGVRDGGSWSRWRRAHPDVLLIEDHSHDAVSAWARRSIADFAFASLRKTQPISDGAILWSPVGHALPDPPAGPPSGGSAVKLAAMVLKSEYLAGGPVDHQTFRTLQLRGERELLADPPSPMAPWNASFVNDGLSVGWRRQRQRNVRAAIDALDGLSSMRPLFTTWPRGHCPFNLILRFVDPASRDACQACLIEDRIYPPIHWAQPAEAPEPVRALASTILTVPLDQRYGAGEVRRVVEKLRAFDASWTSSRWISR